MFGPSVATGLICGGPQDSLGPYGSSSYCCRSSVIMYQGAFEPTKMWALGRIDERAQRNMYELGFPHDGVEQRSTLTTVCIMRRLFSINKQPISTVRNS